MITARLKNPEADTLAALRRLDLQGYVSPIKPRRPHMPENDENRDPALPGPKIPLALVPLSSFQADRLSALRATPPPAVPSCVAEALRPPAGPSRAARAFNRLPAAVGTCIRSLGLWVRGLDVQGDLSVRLRNVPTEIPQQVAVDILADALPQGSDALRTRLATELIDMACAQPCEPANIWCGDVLQALIDLPQARIAEGLAQCGAAARIVGCIAGLRPNAPGSEEALLAYTRLLRRVASDVESQTLAGESGGLRLLADIAARGPGALSDAALQTFACLVHNNPSNQHRASREAYVELLVGKIKECNCMWAARALRELSAREREFPTMFAKPTVVNETDALACHTRLVRANLRSHAVLPTLLRAADVMLLSPSHRTDLLRMAVDISMQPDYAVSVCENLELTHSLHHLHRLVQDDRFDQARWEMAAPRGDLSVLRHMR